MTNNETKKLAIWDRNYLTSKEVIFSKTILAIYFTYLIAGTPLYFMNTIELKIEPGFFVDLYTQLEFFQHISSVVATLGVFLFSEDFFDRFVEPKLAKYLEKEEIDKVKAKWLPLSQACLVAFFHWYAESGVAPSMGTADSIDMIWGIASILPGYIGARALSKGLKQPTEV